MSLNTNYELESPTGEGGAGEVEEDDEEDEDPTFDNDLTLEADPNLFDRTFLVNRDDVPFAATESPPIPRPWQGLPRMAVTINLNWVYDEDQEEWVRQNPFSGGEGDLSSLPYREVVRDTDTSDIPVQANEALEVVNNTGDNTTTAILPSQPADKTRVWIIASGDGDGIQLGAGAGDSIADRTVLLFINDGDGTVFQYFAASNVWFPAGL